MIDQLLPCTRQSKGAGPPFALLTARGTKAPCLNCNNQLASRSDATRCCMQAGRRWPSAGDAGGAPVRVPDAALRPAPADSRRAGGPAGGAGPPRGRRR